MDKRAKTAKPEIFGKEVYLKYAQDGYTFSQMAIELRVNVYLLRQYLRKKSPKIVAMIEENQRLYHLKCLHEYLETKEKK